jgi:hypothetical protein
MSPNAIFLPIFGMVFLTFVVGATMARARFKAISQSRVRPEQLSNGEVWERVLAPAENAADNFENLFEVPVLFYAAVLSIHSLGLSDEIYLFAATLFVVLRAVHSLVHCTTNWVPHRFAAFLTSSLVVYAMWTRLAFQLIRQLG